MTLFVRNGIFFLQGKVEAYGSQSELISQGVNPAHLLGLMKEKEERDEFVLKGDDDEDEDEEKGGYVTVYEVCTNWCHFAYYHFSYSCFVYLTFSLGTTLNKTHNKMTYCTLCLY